VTSRLNLVFCATLTRVSRDNAPALALAITTGFEYAGVLRTPIDCTFFDRRQTQRVVWRELICRDTTVFYIT
jgi:hypothetical protein